MTEQAVTNPLEQQINGVTGASYITSQSTLEGQSVIQVYFDKSTDIDIDQVNVQNRVTLAMPQLPKQVQATGVSVQQTTPSILLAYQVSSTDGQFDAAYLNGLIYEKLYYPLGRVEGVANVSILGGTNLGSTLDRIFQGSNSHYGTNGHLCRSLTHTGNFTCTARLLSICIDTL